MQDAKKAMEKDWQKMKGKAAKAITYGSDDEDEDEEGYEDEN